MTAPRRADEAERIAALYSAKLQDASTAQAFDEIVTLASQVCQAPMAAISLIDADRRWVRASVGLKTGPIPPDASIFVHAITANQILLVPDASADPRFADSPMVKGPPFIRMYGSVPLMSPAGTVLGALCVADTQPRMLNDHQLDSLLILSRQITEQLLLRRQNEELSLSIRRADQKLAAESQVIAASPPKTHVGMKVGAGFALMLVVILAIAALSYGNIQSLLTMLKMVAHTNAVLVKLEECSSSLDEVSISRRGYALTNDTQLLARTESAAKELVANLTAARELTRDNPDQAARFDALEPLLAERLKMLDESNKLMRESGFDLNREASFTVRGAKLSKQIGRLIGEMKATERTLLTWRQQEAQNSAGTTMLLIAGGALVACLFVTLSGAMINRDLGRLRKTQAALADSQGRLIKVTDAIPGTVYQYHLSPTGRQSFRFVSRGIESLMEVSVEAAMEDYSTVWGRIVPEDTDGLWASIQVSRETLTPSAHEFRVKLPSGTLRWIRGTSIPDKPEADGGVTWTGLLLDVTTEKISQLERERADNLIRGVMDSATASSIIATDPRGLIVLFNRGAELMLGYSANEVIEKQTPSLFHDEAEVEAYGRELSIRFGRAIRGFEVFVEHARQGGYDQRDWTYVRKDGTRLIVQLVVTAWRSKNGDILGYLGIARDMTDQVRAHKTLEEAKLAAEEANRAKSDFLANMSHEIRTPMNGVIGMADLLLDTPLNTEQREYAQTITRSADTLMGIINNVLDFSKIEAGKLELEWLPFDMEVLVHEVAQLLTLRAAASDVELIVRYAPGTPERILADPVRMRQILTNLVANAVKFTQDGHVLIDVDCLKHDGEQAELRIRVSDTGIGIPPDKLQQLFGAFMQADTSTTRQYGGTGLGLAITKRLVELHGGHISVTSEENQGTVFTVTLGVPIGESMDGPPPSMGDLTHIRVLAVDDNAVNRRIIAEQLASRSVMNGLAESGDEAIQMLREAVEQGRPYSVVVLDHHMPMKDGMTTAAEIKRDPLIRNTVIVLLSSFGMKLSRTTMQQQGIQACLIKPVRATELVDALASAWGAASGGRQDRLLSASMSSDALIPEGLSSSGAMLDYRRLRLLLVEDNKTNQELVIRVLGKMGCKVMLAVDGQQAVEKTAAEHFDLIFMDCQMPVMDGYEATRLIREREGNGPRTPIIAMTANALPGDRERCIQAGMDDYVAKPMRSRTIRDVISRWWRAPEIEMSVDSADSSITRTDSAAVQQSAVLDVRQGLRATDGDVEILREVLTMFMTDAPGQCTELKSAVSTGDSAKARSIAHSLKGSAANVGAVRLSELAAEMENAAKVGDMALVSQHLPALEPAVASLALAVEHANWEAT